MVNLYLSTRGRLSPRAFRLHFLIASTIGFIAAVALSYAMFGTFAPPYEPFIYNPDPLHQSLYFILPVLFAGPLFIKRQHDRNRSPLLFILFIGLSVGFALFGNAGTISVQYPSTNDLESFVSRHVTQAPVTLVGLWLLVECFFLKGTEGDNLYGPEPLKPVRDEIEA